MAAVRPRGTGHDVCHPGEADSSDALRVRIKHELGWRARVPEYLESVSMDHPG